MQDEISSLIDKVESLLPKIDVESDIVSRVRRHFDTYKTLASTKNMDNFKFGFFSNILKKSKLYDITIEQKFRACSLGESIEHYSWRFCFEPFPAEQLHLEIENCKHKIYCDDLFFEEKNTIRCSELLDQAEQIENIYGNLKKELNIEHDRICAFIALILLDFEKMSNQHQHHHLGYTQMMNSKNHSEKWLTCLFLEAQFHKPNVTVEIK